MALRTDLTDSTPMASVHADQHNEVNAAVLALQAQTDIDTGGGAVASVFGRTGVVVAQSGDYTAAQVGALAVAAQAADSVKIDGIAVTGTPATGNVITATGSTAATWQAPAPAGDMAWEFRPETYGAKGDGAIATDIATNGTQTFTSTQMSAATVGQYVLIAGGRSGSDVSAIGHITAVSGTSITIAAINGNTAYNINATASGLTALWGSDDQAAINACITAAVAYAQAHEYVAVILFKDRAYLLCSPPTQQTTPFVCNAQVVLPPPTNNNGRKLILVLKGVGPGSHLEYWNSTVPNLSGTVLASLQTGPTSDDINFLVQSIVGAPSGVAGLAGPSPVFVNHKPVIEDIRVVAPVYTNITGIDLTYSGGCYLDRVGAAIFATPQSGTGAQLSAIWSDATTFASRHGKGIRFPAGGNNADVTCPDLAVEGFTTALYFDATEHMWIGNLKTIYNSVGIEIGGGPAPHGLKIDRWTAEAYQGGIHTLGEAFISIDQWHTEDSGTSYDIWDDGNSLRGVVHWADFTDYPGRLPVVHHATGLTIVNDTLPRGHYTSADLPPVPASGAAGTNTLYRDAMVFVAGGALTGSVLINGVATGVTSGMVVIPAGATFQLGTSYTGSPTMTWFLL